MAKCKNCGHTLRKGRFGYSHFYGTMPDNHCEVKVDVDEEGWNKYCHCVKPEPAESEKAHLKPSEDKEEGKP